MHGAKGASTLITEKKGKPVGFFAATRNLP